MTQQDKAKELGQKYFPDSANIWERENIEAHAVESACMEMVEFVEKQFEVNRLAHCDELTKEQAQIESDFVTQHLKENKRTPTFIDAIKYGRNSIISELEKIVKSKEEKNRGYVFAFSEVKKLIERLRHEDN